MHRVRGECTLAPAPLKVLLSPRNEENPYLPHLRDALRSQGVVVEWFESESTASQTLNALRAPWELWRRRRQGFEILHLHWVYKFAWPSVARVPLARRIPRRWFECFLVLARAMGFTLVYTWHDVVPVVPVFDDDAKSRASLARHLDGVITITSAAQRDVIDAFGVPADRVDVIPEGPPKLVNRVPRPTAREELAVGDAVVISAFGHFGEYKGFDLLLEAALALPADSSFAIRMLGAAADPAYAARLQDLVDALRRQGRNVEWRDRRYTDEELGALLSATDVVALPFRRITNSATLRFAMAWGATVILPRLPSLDDVPATAAKWFAPGDVADLARVLDEVVRDWPSGADERARASTSWVNEWTWDAVGEATVCAYVAALRRRRAN